MGEVPCVVRDGRERRERDCWDVDMTFAATTSIRLDDDSSTTIVFI